MMNDCLGNLGNFMRVVLSMELSSPLCFIVICRGGLSFGRLDLLFVVDDIPPQLSFFSWIFFSSKKPFCDNVFDWLDFVLLVHITLLRLF